MSIKYCGIKLLVISFNIEVPLVPASSKGKKVLVIEKASFKYRGGNSSLTMNFRFPHEQMDDLVSLLDMHKTSEMEFRRLEKCYEPYSTLAKKMISRPELFRH